MPNPDTSPTEPKRPTLLSRLLRGTVRIGLTVSVIALAAGAVYLGASELTRRANAVPAPDAAAVTPVSVTPIKQETSFTVDRVFIGQVEPQRSADISFELNGRLDKILVDEGEEVVKGQLLATLDIALLEVEQDRLTASRDAIAAQLAFAEKTVERNTKLIGQGFTSQARLDEAVAQQDELLSRIGELDAALRDVTVRIQKSSIEAPFAGRITSRHVDGGETLQSGEMVLGMVEVLSPQVRIGIPLDVNPSLLSNVEIEIADARYQAKLATLRPDIDPLTRTRTALFDLKNGLDVAFGQTARVHVHDPVESVGTWVPTTALKEGARGQWTLLVADAQKTVRVASVEVLHAEDERVFVRGVFPDGTVLIDKGPQRVTAGQRVTFDTTE
ncbi:efflux RND transporter periplasmic adaptor subunit [Ruegeria profundi]|uniref:efflux RND transporter periplasmic adaptor subunit n=1 Tax=Ruegeria profundi TaxID=1685378 RepID=UPI001CD5AC89|nr:efflux RND transporter periplasmic adaptor subunit [Ruegeria profundi]MCA0928075.1 efflux RND transporter periplasmic adaptor subunit [Ruegeria profundi]